MTVRVTAYVGRFAPSTTGLLHAGSLVAALASWLDARAHGGRWLVRLEDLDRERDVPGAAEAIVDQLARCGLHADARPERQSARSALHDAALARLRAAGHAFACGCSRRDVHASGVYPGTCRDGLHGKPLRSWRVRSAGSGRIDWHDRRLGAQHDDVAEAVGDFVVHRADGPAAYQLAVVVDDAAQGVTDVVRGEDLAGNTARQILLQRRLGLATPRYLHTPLMLAADGTKLSKQTGAPPLDDGDPLGGLRAAARVLGIEPRGTDVASFLADAVAHWRARWPQSVIDALA